ncbi:Retrotransposon gag domain [Sesbania bispinosa]|nr:Retrotransposon gag domain [Sesbania bispinosa]
MEVHGDLNWAVFKEELMERFSGLEIQNPYEELAALQQKKTVQEYVEEFEYLALLIPRQPETRLQAMRLARNVELAMKRGVGPHVRLGVQRGFTGRDGGTSLQNFRPSSQPPNWNDSNRDSSYSPKQDQRVGGAVSETPKQPVSRARGVRHLTTQEWEERRKKGLCFRRGMSYSLLHKCADPNVRVVLLGEDEMINEEGEVLVAEEMNSEIEDTLKEGECRMLEYLGMAELFQTRENKGELSSMRMSIKLGDGHRVFSQGVCQKLKVDIGGYCCLIDAYILDIGGLDLLLGVVWMRTLGDVIANWETMTMSFQVSGQDFTLEGAAKPNQVVSSLHSLVHNPYFGSIQLDRMKGNHDARGTQILTCMQQQQLQHLLSTLEVVFHEPTGLPPQRSFFHEPTGLPPQRSFDHGIHLVQGQGAVSVKIQIQIFWQFFSKKLIRIFSLSSSKASKKEK